jgi:hypothetical protein
LRETHADTILTRSIDITETQIITHKKIQKWKIFNLLKI